MTDRISLLNAVVAVPDDDTPRLVFADWLDENGDPEWAELIRLQVRTARGPVPAADRDREAALETAFRKRRPLPKKVYLSYTIERGFPTALTFTATADFLTYAGPLFGDDPITALVFGPRFARKPERFADLIPALVASPLLPRLRRLTLNDVPAPSAEAVALVSSPLLAGLLGLYWRNGGLTEDVALALAAYPHLARLEDLDVRGNDVGPAGGVALRKRFGDRVKL